MQVALRALLLSDSAIAAVVGDRVDWGVRSVPGGRPSIVMRVNSDSEEATQSGPCGLEEKVVHIDVSGTTYKEVEELSSLVRRALNGYSDAGFSGIFLEDAQESIEDGSSEGVRLFRTSMEFEIFWRAI